MAFVKLQKLLYNIAKIALPQNEKFFSQQEASLLDKIRQFILYLYKYKLTYNNAPTYVFCNSGEKRRKCYA